MVNSALAKSVNRNAERMPNASKSALKHRLLSATMVNFALTDPSAYIEPMPRKPIEIPPASAHAKPATS